MKIMWSSKYYYALLNGLLLKQYNLAVPILLKSVSAANYKIHIPNVYYNIIQ